MSIIWALRQPLNPETPRWAFALSAWVDGAIPIILLSSAWRPFRSALLVQFLIPALVVAVGANMSLRSRDHRRLLALLLIIIAFQPRRLAEFPSQRRGQSWPLLLLALALGAATPLRSLADLPGANQGCGRAG